MAGEDSEESSDEIFESDSTEEEEEEDNSVDEEYLVDSSSDDDDVIVEEEEKIVATQRDLVELSNQEEQLQTFILCYTWLKQHPHLLAIHFAKDKGSPWCLIRFWLASSLTSAVIDFYTVSGNSHFSSMVNTK